MEKIYQEALLFDFYGELLTDRQREIFEEAVLNDYSLSEIAEERGISRQGVFDLVRRAGKTLESYEEKLRLVRRFLEIRRKVEQIQERTEDEEIRALASQILEEL
ncbi:MAG: YlxM family DNA-binding protein [Lachnospiraceae bacterium]|nr:YlxM family DNA-binding protein [Lachnospiraceae bacterium]